MAARHRSRRRALQVLFEWDMRKEPIEQAIAHYYESLYSEEQEEEDGQRPKPDEFMEQLARGAVSNVDAIDKQIQAKAENWKLSRMAVVDRNILRLAIYELSLQLIDPAVVIDEAIELARQFSNDEAVAFINGLLDAVHRQTLSAGN